MRVIVFVKATAESEADVGPSTELLTEMGRYNADLIKSGVLLVGERLQPSSEGARVQFSGKARTVINGPFAQPKELIAGFWLLQVRSLEEAIEWVRRYPNPMTTDAEFEIRSIFSSDQFGQN